MDVSRGGLNLRPLDGTSAVNVWSMLGNTPLRVGSRNFHEALDFWHSGANAQIGTTRGHIIVEAPLETKSAILGGETYVSGALRAPLTTPSETARCNAGEIVWDENYIHVCTGPNGWRHARLYETLDHGALTSR